MGGFPEGMSPEERMKEHAEKMQKEQEKREKKIRKILTEEQYAIWQTMKPQPQVLPPMPEGERPGPGPRGFEERGNSVAGYSSRVNGMPDFPAG